MFELIDDNFWFERCQNNDEYFISWDDKHVFVFSTSIDKIVHYFKDRPEAFCARVLRSMNIRVRY